MHRRAAPSEDARQLETMKEWIRNHEEAALLAAFALGVFVGAFMRT
jgi:hypothetical protein